MTGCCWVPFIIICGHEGDPLLRAGGWSEMICAPFHMRASAAPHNCKSAHLEQLWTPSVPSLTPSPGVPCTLVSVPLQQVSSSTSPEVDVDGESQGGTSHCSSVPFSKRVWGRLCRLAPISWGSRPAGPDPIVGSQWVTAEGLGRRSEWQQHRVRMAWSAVQKAAASGTL